LAGSFRNPGDSETVSLFVAVQATSAAETAISRMHASAAHPTSTPVSGLWFQIKDLSPTGPRIEPPQVAEV